MPCFFYEFPLIPENVGTRQWDSRAASVPPSVPPVYKLSLNSPYRKLFSFWVGFWSESELRQKAGLFRLVWVWVVSAAKSAFLEKDHTKSCSLHFRPQHCGPFTAGQAGRSGSGSLRSTDLQSLSLSRPHLADDEAHALYHG
jgi:hypothetical protein